VKLTPAYRQSSADEQRLYDISTPAREENIHCVVDPRDFRVKVFPQQFIVILSL